MRERGPGTTAVHGRHDAPRGPLATPIVQTSTFAFASAAEMRRYLEGDEELFLYTRYANPTVRELEEALAAVEGGGVGPGALLGHGGDDDRGACRWRARGTRSWRAPRSTAARCGSSPSSCRASAMTARFLPAGELERVDRAGRRAEPRPDRREPHEPDARGGGPRGGVRRRRARAGPRRGRRQHLRHPGPPAAPRPRGRPRHAQPDQGPRRPQRPRRRRARRLAREDRRGPGDDEDPGRVHGPARRLPRPARDEDAAPAGRAAVRERARRWPGPSRATRRCAASSTRGCPRTPATRWRGAR